MIEGSMNAEVDTSDDESSIASEEQLQQKQSFGGDVGGTGNDSDEEELEVFSGGSNNEKNHNNLAQKKPKGEAPEVLKMEETLGKEADAGGVDEFGIQYKPRTIYTLVEPPDKNGANNSHNGVHGEDEEDDDEFNVMDEPTGAGGNDGSTTDDAIQAALEKAALRSREEQEGAEKEERAFREAQEAAKRKGLLSGKDSDDITEQLLPEDSTADKLILSSNDAFNFNTSSFSEIVGSSSADPPSSPSSSSALINTSSPSNGRSAITEAKRAYKDIAEVYGSGMGDQSVALLDSLGNNDSNSSSKKADEELRSAAAVSAPAITHKGVNFKVAAIAEEDEEAAELEEQEEERMMQEKIVNEQRVREVWDSIGIPASASVTATANDNGDMDEFDQQMAADPAGFSSSARAAGATERAALPVKLSYNTSLKYFQNESLLAPFESLIQTTTEEKKSGGWFGGGVKTLNFVNHESELKFPFLVAQVDYDPSIPDHLAMLRSIALALCGPKLPDGTTVTAEMAPMGKHWDAIGFQGMDPRTDLNRSMKMLTLLQTIHMLETDPVLSQSVYKLSTDMRIIGPKTNNRPLDASWPFMCVSVMFTKEAIQALRSGQLNEKCNKLKSVMPVLNRFHHACFKVFANLLKEQPEVHHAVHLATLRALCAKSPIKVLKEYPSSLPSTTGGTVRSSSSTAAKISSSVGGKQQKGNRLNNNDDEIDMASFANIDALGEQQEAAEARAAVEEFDDRDNGTAEGGGGGKGWKSMFSDSGSGGGGIRDRSNYVSK